MPKKDVFHDVVRRALEKDGWTIAHDPYRLEFGRIKVYADLGAEAPLGAERDGRKIAVEVKSFIGRSEMTELERAIGQYHFYRFLLIRQEPERGLYLALPKDFAVGLLAEGAGRDLTTI